MDVNKDLIRELAALLDETGLTEIEVSEDNRRVRVARNAPAEVIAQPVAAAAPAPAGAPAPAEEGGAAGLEDLASHPGVVTSPMVGTAFVAPEPSAPPFVKVGDEVREGQTLLIIEAMKTMNPIPAPKAGRVARILVEDSQPVEYDEVLMIIE